MGRDKQTDREGERDTMRKCPVVFKNSAWN